MQYKITEVISVNDAQFGAKRYGFKVEGNDNQLSAFSKFPMKVGDSIEGEIVQKGQYWNFQWVKRNANGTLAPSQTHQNGTTARLENLISFSLIPAIKELTEALRGSTPDVTDQPAF